MCPIKVLQKSLNFGLMHSPGCTAGIKSPLRCCSCCPKWPLTLVLELPATPKTRLLPAGLSSHPGPQVVGPRSCQPCPLLTLPNPSLPRLTLSPSSLMPRSSLLDHLHLCLPPKPASCHLSLRYLYQHYPRLLYRTFDFKLSDSTSCIKTFVNF